MSMSIQSQRDQFALFQHQRRRALFEEYADPDADFGKLHDDVARIVEHHHQVRQQHERSMDELRGRRKDWQQRQADGPRLTPSTWYNNYPTDMPTIDGEEYDEHPDFEKWWDGLSSEQQHHFVSHPRDAIPAFHEEHPLENYEDAEGQHDNNYSPNDWYFAHDQHVGEMPRLDGREYDEHPAFHQWWDQQNEDARNHYVENAPEQAIHDFHAENPRADFDSHDESGEDPLMGVEHGDGGGVYGDYYSDGPWSRTEPDGRRVETNREGQTLEEAQNFNRDWDNYRDMPEPRRDRLPPMTLEPTSTAYMNGILARHAVDGRPIGELNWDPDNGHVGTLSVHPEFRRMGVDKWMFHHARANPQDYPSDYPITHSETLSHMGQDAAANDPVHAMLPKSSINPFRSEMDHDADPYDTWTMPRYSRTINNGGTMYGGGNEEALRRGVGPKPQKRAFLPAGENHVGPEVPSHINPVTQNWSPDARED